MRREMINPGDKDLSISSQCELVSLARSTFYYEPTPESEQNLRLMKLIDQLYLIKPFYGSRRIVKELKKVDENVNRKKVQRLLKLLGLEIMYPKPRTSIGNKEHYKYAYLLKDLLIMKPNQVWGTDITYIPTEIGYLYLVVILDLFSRYVVSWTLSNSLESDFCIYAVENALKTGMKPDILNSDQGIQFTSKAYTSILKRHGIAISMSGRGRYWDNIFVERLWRTLKQEEVYPMCYSTGEEAKTRIDWYFNFYNNERLHQSLAYNTPRAVHYG